MKTKLVWEAISHEMGKAIVYRSNCGGFKIARPRYQGGPWTLYGQDDRPIAYGSSKEVKRIASERLS